jgi:membrane protein YqaA with SNARE-associated domain
MTDPQTIPEERQPNERALMAGVPRDYRSINLLRWFGVFLLMVTVTVGVLGIKLQEAPLQWGNWGEFKESVKLASPTIKLLIFGLYLAFSCTFIPLNTSWLVAAVAMQDTAVTGECWSTVALVSIIGALASTVANLNDYHIFTLLLRSRRIARIRHTRGYASAERWFARSPFAILLFFNITPIPVDFSRVLAVTHKYPRRLFATANFLGRFVRYTIIALITYQLGKQGWIAVVALLGVAIVIPLVKYARHLVSPEEKTPNEVN